MDWFAENRVFMEAADETRAKREALHKVICDVVAHGLKDCRDVLGEWRRGITCTAF